MSDEKDDRKPIEPPGTDKKRALARTVAEGVVGLIPGGSIAAGVVRVTHPPKAEQDRESWQKAISERTNEHNGRLDRHDEQLSPRETVSGTTARLIAALARNCPDRLGHKHYTLDMIVESLPGEDRQELEDAAYELETYGLVDIHRSLNGPWHLSLTPEFYEQVDHQVMGWDTASNAVEIALFMLAEDTGNAPTLHEKTGSGPGGGSTRRSAFCCHSFPTAASEESFSRTTSPSASYSHRRIR